MTDLSTTYMGINIKNPVIVSSSQLTGTLEGIKKCEAAGAGAVVAKSLFEEQILHNIEDLENDETVFTHPEAFEYIHQMGMQLGPDDYLSLIEQAKKETNIPVIASLNCVSAGWWVEYAEKLENAGADALELNISILPQSIDTTSRKIEEQYLTIVNKVTKKTDLPIAVKIGNYFTSLPHFTEELRKAGASAIVIFNRFYRLDIDIDNLDFIHGQRFSSSTDLQPLLRWTGLLYGQIGCDISCTTGVHTGEDAVKLLLTGAKTIQVCSALYQNSLSTIQKITERLSQWMEEKKFTSVKEFTGLMSKSGTKTPEVYNRLQYIKALTGLE
ncbi:MAG: dihydroorotate dehydrogenase-like protein [Spirochaetia bacterium]